MKNDSVRPRLVILVVYKSKQGHWRGFCSPYDVTCSAATKEEARRRLEALVRLYQEGLQKYNYPTHLSIKPLSHSADQVVFKKAREVIANDIKRALVSQFNSFQTENVKKFKVTSPPAAGSYYMQPSHIG